MAKITFVDGIIDIRGKLGNVVFKRAHTGEIIISKHPDMSNVKWSKAQKDHRKRFKAAVAYAKACMADITISQIYQKAAIKQNKRPFDLAVSDYFKGKNLLEK